MDYEQIAHNLLAIRAQLVANIAQVEALLQAVSCSHPEDQRTYLTGFGVEPRRFLCKRCGCEVEEPTE